MRRLRNKANRLLLRLLSRRRGGSARAIRDLHYVQEIIRFSALFSSLVLLPVILLAALALRSLYTEDLSIRAQLKSRAEAIVVQVNRELQQTFDDFEFEARQRVQGGEAAVERLHDLLPPLRAIFRFDQEGTLGFPFALASEADAWPEPPGAFDRAFQRGQRAETEKRYLDAAAAYAEAEALGAAPAHVAEARLANARARLRAGEPRADADLAILAAKYPTLRERHGFRTADLATLLRAEAALARGDDDSAVESLSNLVQRQLAIPWTLDMPGEAFTAQRALELLDGHIDRRWHRIASAQLTTRKDRLYWASEVDDELIVIASQPQEPDTFVYQSGERGLWVTYVSNDTVWVFSFDDAGLQQHLSRTVIHIADQVDPDLSVSIVSQDDGGGAILRHPLGGKLPRSWVAVRTADPEALAAKLTRNKVQTRLVIFLAVLSAALGMFAAVRIVNRELDSARVKADFAANVSHELRSPITQIRLKGESLQLDLVYDEDDRREHYDAIVREAERLSRLVDNVLDFASIERGQKKYSRRPGDVGEVLFRAANGVRVAAEAAGMQLDIDVPDDLPVIWIDRDALGQVATNLLSNAVKYGREGKWVQISARTHPTAIEFRVSDRGIGISSEDQERIFEHFYRVQSAHVRKRRGTGIGLTIVQYIVQAHDGTISVESELGKGTTFIVSLPLTPPAEAGV